MISNSLDSRHAIARSMLFSLSSWFMPLLAMVICCSDSLFIVTLESASVTPDSM